MAQQFYNITRDEMHKCLTKLGFVPMKIQGTVELVYGKIVKIGEHTLSKRVYTAIWPNGQSKERGSDCIRVQLYWMFQGEPTFIGTTHNVKRIKTWEKNVVAAINEIDNDHKGCPACGSPMALRNGKHGEFWGCCTYHRTKCSGRPNEVKAFVPPAPNVPRPNAPAPTPLALYERLMSGNRIPVPPTIPKAKIDPVKVMPAKVNPVVKGKWDRTEKWEFPTDPMNEFRIKPSTISEQQLMAQGIFRRSQCNLMLPSRAGGGKTTMLKDLASYRNPNERFVYQAFNSKNAADARKKFPTGTWSSTTHSHLLNVLRDNIKSMPESPNRGKNYEVMDAVYPLAGGSDTKKLRKRIRKTVLTMIALAKNYAVRPDNMERLQEVMDKYVFDLENEGEVLTTLEVVNECLKLSLPGQQFGSMYDFDDMLWWWVCLDLAPQFYTVALLDEVQDFNECQLEMVRRMLNRGTRIVAVGDPYQAIYRFRGADSEAYHKLAAILAESQRGCETVLLPTNYRSAKRIIAFVRENTIVKDIEAAPNAIEGDVRQDMNYDMILDAIAAEFSNAA
jgi:ssDNA-binding Zn-finger/Zn-ribbon topoisomerase 1